MPSTELEMLQQIKANYLAQLLALSTAIKPDYNLDGQGVQWMQYQMAIIERALAHLNTLIQIAGGPFELQTMAVPGGTGGGCVGPLP